MKVLLIGTYAPKHMHCEKETVDIANYLTVCIFDKSFYPILQIMSIMGINIGQRVKMFADSRDEERVQRSEYQTSYASKEARNARKLDDVLEQQLCIEEDIHFITSE